MKLTTDHIKYAKPSQIAKLLGKKLPAVSRWNNTDFVTGALKIKYPSCIKHEELVHGLVCRKERIQQISQYQQEFDEILDSYDLEQTA
jgi:hypothetical protein